MTDYEALFMEETGFAPYYYDGGNPKKGFSDWLMQQLSDRDKLLTASEARFRAGEEYLMAIELNKAYSEESNFMFCTERDKWRDAIAAYDKAKGGK